jgi:hypothetical protein
VSGARCRSCGDAVVWCWTTGGKRIPIDPTPNPNGNVSVSGGGPLRDGSTITVDGGPSLFDPPGMDRFTAHFATCPDADDW